MTPSRTAAKAILDSLQSRKGFPAFFATIEPATVERMVEEWESIIEGAMSAPQDASE